MIHKTLAVAPRTHSYYGDTIIQFVMTDGTFYCFEIIEGIGPRWTRRQFSQSDIDNYLM
jgi:hypothetical protein